MKMVWYYHKNDIEFNIIYFKALKHYKKRIIATDVFSNKFTEHDAPTWPTKV